MAERDNIPSELLADVKNWCDITWDDEPTDRKVRGQIASGMAYLNGKLGEKADYVEDGMPRTLLLEYVRYARGQALDVFENNYLSMILDMQQEREVTRFVESTLSAQG